MVVGLIAGDIFPRIQKCSLYADNTVGEEQGVSCVSP